MGVLLATGLIVGDSLLERRLRRRRRRDRRSGAPIALVGDEFASLSPLIGGVLVFAAIVAWLYRYTAKQRRLPRSSAAPPASG